MPSTYRITPSDRAVAEEFRRRPIGKHSPALQRVLNAMRTGPLAGKYVLVATRPHREWMLAQLPERPGQPIKLHPNRIFHSIEEAEWEVFKLRWEQHTGERLED
ncbi:MAG: hypothetical protein IRY94_05795 [Rhodospirillaceae bacterium]|nr:hypothetical protein [Rhodospirillaceae bacterium]